MIILQRKGNLYNNILEECLFYTIFFVFLHEKDA